MIKNLTIDSNTSSKKITFKVLKLLFVILTSLFIYIMFLLNFLLLGFKLNFVTLYFINCVSMYPILLGYYYNNILLISNKLLSFIGIHNFDDDIEEYDDDIIDSNDIPENNSLFSKFLDAIYYVYLFLLDVLCCVPAVLLMLFAGLPILLYLLLFD